MGEVEQALVVGVGVDRGHHSLPEAELLVEHLDHRSETVGGAGGVREDVVGVGPVAVLVHAHHDGQVLALRRGGDDHLAGAGGEVLSGVLAGGEDAGGLDDDADSQPIPAEGGGVAFAEDPDPPFRTARRGGHDLVPFDRDRALEGTGHRVVFQEVGQGGGIGQVVDGDDLDVRVVLDRAEDVPSDPAESVDADAHEGSFPEGVRMIGRIAGRVNESAVSTI